MNSGSSEKKNDSSIFSSKWRTIDK